MHLEDLGRVLGDNSLRRDGKIIIHP
jgi:hypothetical protein